MYLTALSTSPEDGEGKIEARVTLNDRDASLATSSTVIEDLLCCTSDSRKEDVGILEYELVLNAELGGSQSELTRRRMVQFEWVGDLRVEIVVVDIRDEAGEVT